MSTAASTSAPPATASTWAPVTAGRAVEAGAASGGRWVRPACRADEAGIASAAATTASAAGLDGRGGGELAAAGAQGGQQGGLVGADAGGEPAGEGEGGRGQDAAEHGDGEHRRRR